MVVKDNIEFIDEDTAEKHRDPRRDSLGRGGSGHPAHPQRRRDHGLAGEPGRLRDALQRRRSELDHVQRDLSAYDGINYGVWYDDVQFAQVAIRHAQAAAKLGVKKIVLGECGHAHKALTVIADRVLTGDLNIPRESSHGHPAGHRAVGQDQVRQEPQRLSGDPARSVQPRTPDGYRFAPARDHQGSGARGAIPGDDAPRRGELLLRRRLGLRHHVRPQLRRLAAPHDRAQEVPPDSRGLPGRAHGPRAPQVRLRARAATARARSGTSSRTTTPGRRPASATAAWSS